MDRDGRAQGAPLSASSTSGPRGELYRPTSSCIEDRMSEASRTALVTGGATGIGFAITRRLLDDGLRVAICDPDEKTLTAALSRHGSEASARNVAGFVSDLATLDGCEHTVRSCEDQLGSVDVLVNCAAVTGRAASAPFAAQADEDMVRILAVNLLAPLRLAKLVEPSMRERSHGVIVNITSVGAQAAQWHAAVYCTSKAALEGATRAVALEYATVGIRVVSIAPGPIRTPTAEAARESATDADRPFRRVAPLRGHGTPEDVAAAVSWAVSDEAAFVTGTSIVVDGGFLAY